MHAGDQAATHRAYTSALAATLPGFTSCLQVLKVDAQLLALNTAIDAKQAEQGDALSVCAFVTFKTEEGRAACMRANPSSTGRRVFLRKDLRFRCAQDASMSGFGRHRALSECFPACVSSSMRLCALLRKDFLRQVVFGPPGQSLCTTASSSWLLVLQPPGAPSA